MNKKNLALIIAALVILAAGAGYYFWNKERLALTEQRETVAEESSAPSLLDTILGKLIPGDEGNKESRTDLKEYKDAKDIFSITYPDSWLVRPDQGQRLTGANITPQEILNRYPSEEQGFIKGLVVAADESDKSSEEYFRDLVGERETGQTEARELTVNGYPAHMVKGEINGISYVIYIISQNGRVVYFNYRTKEEESAHERDIRKAIDFAPYVADFEAVIHSIKFLK